MKVDIVEAVDSDRSPNSNDHLLVRELTHRINNEFTSIIGHTSLMAARSSNAEVKDALSGVSRLLHHCADIHRALQIPALSTLIDASSYIRTLCQSIRRARLENRNIELVFVEYPILISSDRCWRLGMIVSELITNSMRHAFDGRGGTIRVELSSSGPYVECCVMDNGSSRERREPGQGLKIVEALAKELNGNAVYRFGPKGAFSVVIFPIDEDAPQMESHFWINEDNRDNRRRAASPF